VHLRMHLRMLQVVAALNRVCTGESERLRPAAAERPKGCLSLLSFAQPGKGGASLGNGAPIIHSREREDRAAFFPVQGLSLQQFPTARYISWRGHIRKVSNA
jgi:hypothetical protein